MKQEDIARKIWEANACDADWTNYDRVDDYCISCSIKLDIDGYMFEGEGQIVGADKEIVYVNCTCPDGTVVRVA